MTGTDTGWWAFLQAELDERGWNIAELARKSDVDRSVVTRWRDGGDATVTNARKVATALGVPLLQVLVHAGVLTGSEIAGVELQGASLDPAVLSDEELLDEIRRRFQRGLQVTHSGADVAARPAAFPEVPLPGSGPRRLQQDS
ncbi:helix-turn-helix domain-containing protein [Saccharothrix stipae]